MFNIFYVQKRNSRWIMYRISGLFEEDAETWNPRETKYFWYKYIVYRYLLQMELTNINEKLTALTSKFR